MRTYCVTVRATFEQVIEVDARNEDIAIASAIDNFKQSKSDRLTLELIDYEDVSAYRRKVA